MNIKAPVLICMLLLNSALLAEKITLGNIKTENKFKGQEHPYTSKTLDRNLYIPTELLSASRWYGTYNHNPEIARSKMPNTVWPPDADLRMNVLYTKKSKKSWAFAMKTVKPRDPVKYWKQLSMLLEKNYGGNSGFSESSVPSSGKLPEFIANAVFQETRPIQIFHNGNFLAIMYTRPYEKILRKRSTYLYILYIDLDVYQEACDEL